MSISNIFSQNYGWKVDPDHRQDRKSGPVITYKLSPEELAKYKTEPNKKPSMIGIESMMKKKGDCEDMKIRDEMTKRLADGKDINTIVDELVAEGNDERIVARLAVDFGYQAKKHKKKQQEQVHEVIKTAVQEEKQHETSTASDVSKQDSKIIFRRMYETIQGNYKYDIDYGKKVITLERYNNAKIKFDEMDKLLQDLNALSDLIKAGG